MTLEVILWAIPAASLSAASVLIAFRAWRLTRDSTVARAILARTAELASACGPFECPAVIPIDAGAAPEKTRPAIPPAPVVLPSNGRLRPVPIVVCGGRRPEAALAS